MNNLWTISFADLLTLLLCFFLIQIRSESGLNTLKTLENTPKTASEEGIGSRVAGSLKEGAFRDWKLTLNDPMDASKNFEGLEDAKEVWVSGCFKSDLTDDRRLSEVVLKQVEEALRKKGVQKEQLFLRVEPRCEKTEVTVRVYNG